MVDESAKELRNRIDPAWSGPNPQWSDDYAWYAWCGMCGGCGSESCHKGPCTESPVVDMMGGFDRLLCDMCPVRHAEGYF